MTLCQGQSDRSLEIRIEVLSGPRCAFGRNRRSVGIISELEAYSCQFRFPPLRIGTMTTSLAGWYILSSLPPASLTDPDFLHDSQSRQCHHFATARLVENQSTIPAMMFAIRECESRSTAHARVGINPCGRSGGCKEVRRDGSGRWWE